MSVKIRVTPEVLRNEAAVLQGTLTEIRNSYMTIRNLAAKFPSCWSGEASSLNSAALSKVLDSADSQLKEMDNRTERLLTIAGVYSSAEQANMELSDKLQRDIIQ